MTLRAGGGPVSLTAGGLAVCAYTAGMPCALRHKITVPTAPPAQPASASSHPQGAPPFHDNIPCAEAKLICPHCVRSYETTFVRSLGSRSSLPGCRRLPVSQRGLSLALQCETVYITSACMQMCACYEPKPAVRGWLRCAHDMTLIFP